MKDVDIYEWDFDTSQTNTELKDDTGTTFGGAGIIVGVTFAKAVVAVSVTVDVSIRVGFAATTLPAIVTNSANGKKGIFLSHPAVPKGGGEVNAPGELLARGQAGEVPRITMNTPTGGFVRLMLGIVKVPV